MPDGLANVPLPIDGFLSWLRAQAFVVGVDSYLQVQQLIERAGTECSPSDLKTVLCPLFARNEDQQEAFYRSFDRWFDLFAVTPAPGSMRDAEEGESPAPTWGRSPTCPPKSRRSPFRGRYAAAAAVVLVLAAAITFWMMRDTRPTQPKANDAVTTTAQDTPSVAAVPPPEQPPPQPEAPTPPPVASRSFWRTHRALIRWAIAMAPLLFYLLYELRRFSRRRHVLQKQKGRNGPYSWPVRIQSKPRVYHSAEFYSAARRLQRRQRGESLSLDVDGSVQATIDSLGFPHFKYKPDSRLPEYLVLIDRTSFRDHQASLFETLSRALQAEGLFATTLFFDGDPRVCQPETQDADFYLVDLERRHSGDRLVIFGDGEKLIDSVTGRLAGWAALFDSWNDRAVLTPVAPSAWGLNEKALANQFIVLPASVDGLLALVDHFEQSSRSDIRSWRDSSDEPRGPHLDGPMLVPKLREFLGAPAFEWLCACAVYPELHWDLTLHLGSIPGVPENPIDETNLLRLIRLPWFRSGSIPDEMRWALIQELGPARQNAVREAILQLLEENPPPKESFAADSRSFQIVLQRYCLNRRDRKRRRELIEALKSVPQSELLRAHTTLGALESMRLTALDFVLPRAMRRALFANGLPAFGLKNSLRLLVVAPLCLLPAILFTVPFRNNAQLIPDTVELSRESNQHLELDYFITVQKYKNGQPIGAPLRLMNEMLFHEDDRIAITVSSPKSGFLYILNEGPLGDGSTSVNVLYPEIGTTAQISAGQPVRIPRAQWFVLDQSSGVEKLYLAWSAKAVPEFEAAKDESYSLVNGGVTIRAPERVMALTQVFGKYLIPAAQIRKDAAANLTSLTSDQEVLVHLIRLAHESTPQSVTVTSLDGGSGALTNEFTNDWVVAMVKNKIAASIILQQIHSMPTRFDLSTQEIIRLTKAGVSAEILEAMRNPKAAAPSKPAAGKTASGTPATNTQTATAPAANALTAPTPPASSNAPPTTPPPAEKPPALPATQSITIGATMPFSIRLAEDIPANVEPGRTIRFTTVGAFPAEGPTAVAANTALIGEIVDGGKKKPTFRLKDVTAVDGTKLSIHVGGSTPDGRRSFDVPTMARHSQEIAAPAGTGYIAYTQGAQTVTVRSQLSNLPTGGQTVEAPGGPDHLFPYSLALKNRDTGDLKTSGELVEGGYQVVLRMNHDQVASAPKPAQRWVYVLAIGSDGTLKRVFPARENSSLNHLPNGGTPEEIQLEVIMIGEPFGVETLALLASEEPVSPMALEMDSLPGGVDRSRLADFLRQILRANHAGAAPAPDKWSMDLLTFHSVPK